MTENEILQILSIVETTLRNESLGVERYSLEEHIYKIIYREDDQGKKELIIRER